MKKISVSAVVALSIVTLGVYNIVWLALRRNEIVQKHKINLPHIAWMIVAAVLLCFSIIAAIVVGILVSLEIIDFSVLAFAIPFGLMGAAFLVGLWWMIAFGAAFSKIVGGRVPLWWTIVFYVFLGIFIIPVYQFYINQRVNETSPSKHVGPTRRFVAISIVLLIPFTAIEVWSFASLPGEFEAMKHEITQTQELIKKAEQLSTEYDTCVATLENNYTEEQAKQHYDAYMRDYDKCEAIRVEQNAVADKANGV